MTPATRSSPAERSSRFRGNPALSGIVGTASTPTVLTRQRRAAFYEHVGIYKQVSCAFKRTGSLGTRHQPQPPSSHSATEIPTRQQFRDRSSDGPSDHHPERVAHRRSSRPSWVFPQGAHVSINFPQRLGKRGTNSYWAMHIADRRSGTRWVSLWQFHFRNLALGVRNGQRPVSSPCTSRGLRQKSAPRGSGGRS